MAIMKNIPDKTLLNLDIRIKTEAYKLKAFEDELVLVVEEPLKGTEILMRK